MLTPEQIYALQDWAEQIAAEFTDYLIQDIARRISQAGQLTSTAAYQVWRAQQLGLSRREIRKRLQKLLKKSNAEIKQLLTQVAEVGYRYDLERLPTAAGIAFADNGSLQQIVQAAVAMAQEGFTNLTQTLGMVDPYGKALPLQKAYRSTMDYAFKQVFTGATDYNTAIRQATKNLAEKGVQTIDYQSGVSTSLEAATRRNIMGGLGLMQEQINELTHEQLGANGWEISAHANSAPDHEPIQGRQYSDAEYKALNDSLVRRIGTLHCGHVAFSIILGVNQSQYTEEQLKKFREDNAKGITYQGKHYTGYEATQMQREIERAIRKQKKCIQVDEATGDKERLQTDRIRLNRLNEEYRNFSKAAGLRTQPERAQVAGFTGTYSKTGDTEIDRLQSLDYSRQERLRKNPELALPNAQSAVIEQDKFLKYLFSAENPRGYAKGVAFTSRLGYDINNWQDLREEIFRRASLFPVRQKGDFGHGMTYEMKMILYGKTGRPANVIVPWIVENGIPRMTSAYIKEVDRS